MVKNSHPDEGKGKNDKLNSDTGNSRHRSISSYEGLTHNQQQKQYPGESQFPEQQTNIHLDNGI
jgi:hypothetical protein